MIPSFKHGIIASSRPRIVAGGGVDVTPNAVNWGTISYDNDLVEYTYAEQQITGINQTITLKVQFGAVGWTIYYYVSNTSGDIGAGSPIINGMTSIANNGTFTVSNNQWVTFGARSSCAGTTTLSVLNQSDGDVTLDTMMVTFLGEC